MELGSKESDLLPAFPQHHDFLDETLSFGFTVKVNP